MSPGQAKKLFKEAYVNLFSPFLEGGITSVGLGSDPETHLSLIKVNIKSSEDAYDAIPSSFEGYQIIKTLTD